jgi:predicted transcriptional regulator
MKALRLTAGKTQAGVARVASVAKLKRIEAGQVTQRMADVRTLCFM